MPEPKRKPFATGIEFPGKPSTTSIAGVKPVKGSSLRDWVRNSTLECKVVIRSALSTIELETYISWLAKSIS